MMLSISKRLPILPLLFAAVILMPAAPIPAQTSPPPVVRAKVPPRKAADQVGRKGRETLVIDGAWRFLTDPQNIGEAESWPKAPPVETKEIAVPALWTTQTAPGYSGIAWYWREFEAAPTWKTQTVRLRFEAVAEKSSVWINGVKLGDHDGGAVPFEFNVTKQLHFGAVNVVAVRVEGDAKRGAGIWQGVLLLAHDEAYLSEVSLTAGGLGQMVTAITLENTSDNSGVATLEGRVITLSRLDKDVHRSEQSLSLTPGRNVTTLLTSVKGKNLHTWTPETPNLYALQLAFRQGNDVLDTQQTAFGFREFGWKDSTITLNGLPFKLTSVAPATPLPVVIASTEDAARARASMQRLKAAGVSILFLDAPPPDLLKIADEVGMLVVESPRQGQSRQTAFEELQALLQRDRSHPCVLGWRIRDANVVQISTLHTMDPSRFVVLDAPGTPKLYLPGPADSAAVTVPPGFLPVH